jgi:hypothetical protein
VRVHRRGTWRRFDNHRLRAVDMRGGQHDLFVQRLCVDRDKLFVRAANHTTALSVQWKWTRERGHRRGVRADDLRVGLHDLFV